MKYKNKTNSIVIIADRESVQPYSITRDFSAKDIESMPGIEAAVRKGYLEEYNGKEEAVEKPVSPRAAAWNTEMSSGKPVQKLTAGGQIVEYVVADSDGCDSVSTGETDSVASLSGTRSSDYIVEGLSAKDYNKTHNNASAAFDAEIDRENDEANFDDESTLAESEDDRDNILDVDHEISRDASQILIQNGKAGAQLKDVRAVVEESTAKAIGELDRATRPSYDDAELQAGLPAKVVEFLKQNFSSKKWEISKSQDVNFLRDIEKVTQSENVKSLVSQRLSEIEKSK